MGSGHGSNAFSEYRIPKYQLAFQQPANRGVIRILEARANRGCLSITVAAFLDAADQKLKDVWENNYHRPVNRFSLTGHQNQIRKSSATMGAQRQVFLIKVCLGGPSSLEGESYAFIVRYKTGRVSLSHCISEKFAGLCWATSLA